jgi:LysR family transcriptional regulator, glycine cleavage system transcriptional activator
VSAPMRPLALQALPAFAAASRTGSLTLAAEEMHLTPGAVSRQVKALEESLGVALFQRSHNAIALTDAGRQFLTHVTAALTTLETGSRAIRPERSRLVIQVPITLARRWLIPRLGSFREANPTIDLSIQSLALGATETPDVIVTYRRGVELDSSGAFLVDRTIAVCSPRLLGGVNAAVVPQTVLDLPILLDTADGWSWRRWCAAADIPFAPRGGSIAFDTDEASIDACVSGLGIGQASPFFVEKELRSGALIVLSPQISPVVGAYETSERVPGRPAADRFFHWLTEWVGSMG